MQIGVKSFKIFEIAYNIKRKEKKGILKMNKRSLSPFLSTALLAPALADAYARTKRPAESSAVEHPRCRHSSPCWESRYRETSKSRQLLHSCTCRKLCQLLPNLPKAKKGHCYLTYHYWCPLVNVEKGKIVHVLSTRHWAGTREIEQYQYSCWCGFSKVIDLNLPASSTLLKFLIIVRMLWQ